MPKIIVSQNVTPFTNSVTVQATFDYDSDHLISITEQLISPATQLITDKKKSE